MGKATYDYYFRRFGFYPPQIAPSPHPDLGLVVVIPCFNEPDLIDTLESLWACERPASAVEAIVVINSSTDAPDRVQAQNEATSAQARSWITQHTDSNLTFHVLNCRSLPPKQAGVGLARKIGMDEAAARFHTLDRTAAGIIACLDADSICEANYLANLAQHFQLHPHSSGCSVYFEHPLNGPLAAEVYRAVTLYELHLRYYIQALRYAHFPYAHHTVGSAMAVRAEVYMRQGGMNKRQAGEDFYFLHKIMPLGGYTDLLSTRVCPSPRPSDRVPFGTGRAVRQILATGEFDTYCLQAFLDLKLLFHSVVLLQERDGCAESLQNLTLSGPLRTFLQLQQFDSVLREITSNTASAEAFRKRFFAWFNGFAVMKFIHHACDTAYGRRPLAAEAGSLLQLIDPFFVPEAPCSELQLLERYRKLDRTLLPA